MTARKFDIRYVICGVFFFARMKISKIRMLILVSERSEDCIGSVIHYVIIVSSPYSTFLPDILSRCSNVELFMRVLWI